MPHRGRYTERPAPATDAARVGQDAIRVCSEAFKPGQSRGLPSLRRA